MEVTRTRETIQGEINALKSLLADSDYKSNKMIESLIDTMQDATALNFVARFVAWLASAVAEYGAIIRSRAEWRTAINELEAELDTLPDEESEVEE